MLIVLLCCENGILFGCSVVSIWLGKFDCLLCGIGCLVRMVIFYECGLFKNGDVFIGELIIGLCFDCVVDGFIKIEFGWLVIVFCLCGWVWIIGYY